jgi:hypothetical protein
LETDARADLEPLDELSGGEAAAVGDVEADKHPGGRARKAGVHEHGGEVLLQLTDGLRVSPVEDSRHRRRGGRHAAASSDRGRMVGAVGVVAASSAVSGDFAGDGRDRAMETHGDLAVGEPIGQPCGDMTTFFVSQPSARHR